MRDDEAMATAIDAAARARRITAPNPWVGCAIVRDATVLATGATAGGPGSPHAERVALAALAPGTDARGATVYATLEPCDHHGTTPPCVDALIEAGVARVVVGIEDPDPRVAGKGMARLRAAGIDVVCGVGAAAVARQLAPYLVHRRTGRASCVVKSANSIDGLVAAADGSSRWITGEQARANVQSLRADAQAIIVGVGTAVADRPRLTVRELPDGDDTPLGPPALRVVLDAHGRVDADGPLFDTSLGPTLVVTTDQADQERIDMWAKAGAAVSVVETASASTGRGVDLGAVLELLGRRGVLTALVEGGPEVHGALIQSGLVDRLVVYLGNTMLGVHGIPALAHDGPLSMDGAPRWNLVAVEQFGNDVRLDYIPEDALDPQERS
ncbi:MAG TPA: bifunctional diaminohydroxyphosphoribosylaminopyrimidine deaminase/5-amino-6-(5-phosphoribosylamino)uracil reductase RibD [Acidimicrobiia bacterium]